MRRERRESRAQRAMVSGVRAKAKAPRRSEKPPMPLRVLCRGELGMGVSQVL